MKQVKGTKYRKVQSRHGGKRWGRKVHLVFWHLDEHWSRKYWKFVCGKLQHASLEFDMDADFVDDETEVTCLACRKHAPEVVEYMADTDVVELDYD